MKFFTKVDTLMLQQSFPRGTNQKHSKTPENHDGFQRLANPDLEQAKLYVIRAFGRFNNRLLYIIKGQRQGLTVMLDTHQDLSDINSLTSDSQGFTAVVHDTKNFPLTVHNSIKIQPGRETKVAISAIDIKSDTGLRKSDPSKRRCNFPDDEEAQLHLYKNYSQVTNK